MPLQNGTYRGFSPTNESIVGLGELSVCVSDDEIEFRLATGLEVTVRREPRCSLQRLTESELNERLISAPCPFGSMTGERIGQDGPLFVMVDDMIQSLSPESPHVIVLCLVSPETDLIFGPTFLFSPEQVENGYFDQMLIDIETRYPDTGLLPRLSSSVR